MIYPAHSPSPGQYYDEFKVFLKRQLGFSDTEIQIFDIPNVKPMLKRRRDADGEWRMVRMLRAVFRRREDRDHVMARIGRLVADPKYRMEMEIPDHLSSLYRALEKKAYDIRKNENLKTSVRFDDDNLSLVLLTKSPNEPWTKCTVRSMTNKEEIDDSHVIFAG